MTKLTIDQRKNVPAKQQVKDLQFKVNMSEWITNIKKKYSDKEYYDSIKNLF